jgi:glucose/arabinose dehydrogenase
LSYASKLTATLVVLAAIVASSAWPQAPSAAPAPVALAPLPEGQTNDPFPQPIVADRDIITVTLKEFASLPDIDGIPARMMTLRDEPGTRRLFISDMTGVLYTVSYDGKKVTPYLDLRDPKFGVAVQAQGRERGVQNFVLHPQFAQRGTPGYGKFYTYSDVSNQTPPADFTTPNPTTTHDTVLLEWTAKSPRAATYDGGAPRELIRLRQPYANHNGGALAFNSTARPGSADYGLLYMGVADGGSGGDPMKQAQNMGSAFGKIIRIDPLGKNSRNGKYGVPASNPFLSTVGALPEMYAYGIRNSQRFGWDSKNGAMYMSDIGQNIVEEVSPVTAGANLGWNDWEGSYKFVSTRAVIAAAPRSDPKITYPIVEWGQLDPILLANNQSASVGVIFYRSNVVPQLNGKLLFGDMPSGELFHVSADNLPNGGQDPIRRVLFVTGDGAAPRPLLAILQEKNRAQGKTVATRADLRFDADTSGHIFLLNKADGTLRVVAR